MKQRYNALTTLAVVLLTWVVVMAAASVPACAEEGEAQSEGRDLLELLEEQGIRKDSDASALTIQGLGAKVANLDANSASEANKKIKERTKQGFHITINMTADWNNQTIEIPSGADVTIKMNGHTINRNRTSGGRNDSAIQVGNNALLSIDGGTKTSFKSMRIYSPSGSYTMQSRNVAGLITGGYNTNGGGGIDMAGGSSVTLNNVYLAGNRAEQNWGVDGHGGGIYVGGENTSITLNNTQIMGNYAYNCGGGIYANNAVCLITLNKSTLDGNVAARGTGGGIHCDSTGIHISGDPTSSIRYSYAKSNGGGVYFKKDSCSLKGLKVESNRSDTATGGGAYANAKKTTFANLTITNNKATYAGGLRTMGADESITSCTITNNATYSKDSSYGAGACIEGYSSTISGTCVIKDNQGNNGVYLAPEITGTPDSTRGGFVKLDLARGSSVCVIKGSPGHNYVPITPTDARVPNCIRYLTTMNGYHVTYNDSSRVIYIVKGSAGQNENSTTGKAARIPQAQTTLNPSQTTPATTGEKYNGRDVVRGYVRYPSVEDGTKDFATSFYYSDGYFLDNPTKYNNHLATLSMCMAMSGFYLNAGSTTDYINKHASARQFMSDIGCADDDIYVNDYNVQKPGSFTIGVTIASKTIKDASGVEYTLVPIAVRGAGYEAEWTSNVTMKAGVGTEHWGFADAANKVTAEVNSYLARHNLTEKAKQGKVKFWIAGYSRAGATSNLTARRLLDQYASGAKKCDVFGYPIEAPQGGSDDYDKANPERYYSIHNVINKADLVPLVGPTKMGFKRYGVDHYIPGSAAGNAAKSSVGVNRAGGLSQMAGTNFSGHEPAVPLVTERTVNTWHDNQSYATNSGAKYNAARSTMLPQLEAVDPSINFDDFFHTADMDFFPSPDMRYKAAKAGGNEEEFIVQFINDVQRWAIGNRASYSKNLETAFQNVIGTVFSMDNASMQGFTNRASTCMDRIPTVAPFSSKRSLRNIYADVIGAWHKRNEKEKKQYIDTFITAIDGTGAYDYLTAEQKAKVRGSLPTFLDFAFKIVDGDYNNESFGGTAKCMMLPTFALNASRIMSNHYPEVNLAWLRAEDSYYNNDKTAYVVAKASNVPTPAAKVGDKELAAGENTVLAGKQSVTLDVKDLKGEAVYYKVSKGSTRLSQDTCKNGYEIYRGPFQLNLESGNTYTITAYAMSYGTKSGEVTYTVKAERTHKVTIFSEPDALRKDPPTTNTYSEGTKIQLKTSQSVQTDTTTYVFSRWEIVADNGLHLSLLPGASNTNDTTLTLPASGTHSLSQNYSLTIKPLYLEKTRYDNLHDIVIQAPNDAAEVVTVKNLRAREGATVRYALEVPQGDVFVNWKAEIRKSTGDPTDVTDQLKPHNADNKWAGKNSQELCFVMPKNDSTFAAGDELFFTATVAPQVTKIAIAEVTDPANDASGTIKYNYYKNNTLLTTAAGQLSVKWESAAQSQTNSNTTVTTTTTYTADIVLPKTVDPQEFVFARGNVLTATVDGLAGCKVTKVERLANGDARVRLEVVRTKTEGNPQYTIDVQACDVNGNALLTDANNHPYASSQTATANAEDRSFRVFWGPSVPGGRNNWTYSVPEQSGLQKVTTVDDDRMWRVATEGAELVLLNAFTPIINRIQINDFPVPESGAALATKNSEGIDLTYSTPEGSVFGNNTYTPAITDMSWRPVGFGSAGIAMDGTEYCAVLTLGCADGKQICFDNDTSVSVNSEKLGITSHKFDPATSKLYLYFRKTGHAATIKNDASADEPVKQTWHEGTTKSLKAKDDYDDKVFADWTVTMKPQHGDPVVLSTDEQLSPLSLTAQELKQPEIKLLVPAASSDVAAFFKPGYSLSIEANYHAKAQSLSVDIAAPTKATADLDDEAVLEWSWSDEVLDQGSANVGIVWSEDVVIKENENDEHTFTATMRVGANTARQFMRGEGLPSISLKSAPESSTIGASWNADGSLTIVATFKVFTEATTYKVSIGAYDANSYDAAGTKSKLQVKVDDNQTRDMDDVVQSVGFITATQPFVMVAPVIEGAEFVRWEVPTGSAIAYESATNHFTLTDTAATETPIAIHALYKPVVKKVTLGIEAPQQGVNLATTATASITSGDLVNPVAFTNVTPAAAVGTLTWTPTEDDGKADYDTQYTAAARLVCKKTNDQGQPTDAEWVYDYADNVEVACEGSADTWFGYEDANDPGTAYVFFPITQRDDRHQVTIRDFDQDDAGEDEPAEETWYEGDTEYLVAKQYNHKVFTGWTITRHAEGLPDKDITNVGGIITEGNRNEPFIAIAVPESNSGDFPQGYSLTIVANYTDKVGSVSTTVPIPNPMDSPQDATTSVQWTYDGAPTGAIRVPVTWTRSEELEPNGESMTTRIEYVATITLTMDAADAAKFMDVLSVDAQLAEATTEEAKKLKIDTPNITCERIDDVNATDGKDGFLITVPFQTIEEVARARTVAMQACDVNASGHPILAGTEVEETIVYANDTDGITLYAPDVEGGTFVGWEYDAQVLQKTAEGDKPTATFTFIEGAEFGKTYAVKALYKPVVDELQVDFAEPKAGDPLATKDEVTASYVLQNEAFQAIGATVDGIAWKVKESEGQTGWTDVDAGTAADFGKEYQATVTCKPSDNVAYDASKTIGIYNGDWASFAVTGSEQNVTHAVTVGYEATDSRVNHKVTVVNNAAGVSTSYLWQETATKHLVAQPSEDKAFTGWTITDQRGNDVTNDLLGNSGGTQTIALTMPQGGDSHPEYLTGDYALTATANYVFKASTLNISELTVPTSGDGDSTYARWQWAGSSSPTYVDVMWTRNESDDDYVYTATMRLSASEAQEIRHNGLSITINGNSDQTATASWDEEGNLTVTTSFTRPWTEDGGTYRAVEVQAYDANSGAKLSEHDLLPIEQMLLNRPYQVLVEGNEFVLAPHQVAGGVFCGWQVDSGSSVAIVPGGDNEFRFTSELAAGTTPVVRALYKPVVSGVNVSVSTPTSGQLLANAATASVKLANTALVGVSFAQPTNVTAALPIWEPAGDATADPAKEYEAAVGLTYTYTGADSWKYAYAPEATATTSWPAYATLDTVTSTAYVFFDENSPDQILEVTPVDDMYGVLYKNNNATKILELLNTAGEDGRKTTTVKTSTNPTGVTATITWDTATCEVDGGKLEGAIWRARGRVAIPSTAEANDAVEYSNLYVYASVFVDPASTLNLVHVDQPADIYGLRAGAGPQTVRDQLPTQTDLILEEGVITTGDITWTKVECVDAEGNFRYSAKWTATGTVALPADASNTNGVSLDVTMDVYVDLADLPDNLAEMPYAMPESDIYDTEKAIILDTDEENGTIYYRIASGVKGDYSEIYPSDFREYLGEPIYLDRDSIDDSSMLCIEAYTVAPNKEQSYTATFLYELSDYMYIPEGEELVFDGTEQVGVWLVDDYELVGPSAGARIDEDGDAVATNAGTYTVVARAQNKLTWYLDWPDEESSPTTTTDDQTITFTIAPVSVKECDIDLAKSVAYTGSAVTPKPKVTLGDWTAVEGRDYTLAYKDNVTVGKARVTITGKGNLKDSVTLEFEVDGGDSLAITYAGHVQTYGDIPAVQNGATLGTVGQSKRIESFSATVTGGTIEYRAHVQRQGWDEGWKSDGGLCGTTGQSKRVEAVQVRLSDRLTAAGYHVWYRVHAQNYGWLGWACDGAPAGTSGQSKRLEAIEMVVLRGDARPEGYDASRTSFNGRVSANAHVQTYGWLGYASAGKFGTTGKSKRMEAFWLKPDGVPDCGVEYQSHVQRQGWETDWHANGDISGTQGKSRRVEAVRIRLTGEAAKNLSIWYRVHSQTFGWSGWARDGQDAGTAGYSKRVESIEVVVLSKDAAAPGSTKNALRSR